MACTPCFTKRIDNCAESVTIDGQLLPNTVYTWLLLTGSGMNGVIILQQTQMGHLKLT